MDSFRKEIIEHERRHEEGANDCLRSDKARTALKTIEGITGDLETVRTEVLEKWEEFNTEVRKAIKWGPAFWHHGYLSPAWEYSSVGIKGHEDGQHGC